MPGNEELKAEEHETKRAFMRQQLTLPDLKITWLAFIHL